MNYFEKLPEELNKHELHFKLLDFFREYFTRTINSTHKVRLAGYNIKHIDEIENYTSPSSRLHNTKIVYVINCHAINFADFDLCIDICGNILMAFYKDEQYRYKRVYNVDEVFAIRRDFTIANVI